MLKNYLVSAYRNLINNKIYSLINILGFALGLASCLLILLFVYNELSFEKIHSNKSSIYRIALHLKHGDTSLPFAAAMPPLAPALQEMFPEVESTVRIRQTEKVEISQNDKTFAEEKFVYSENELLEIFSLGLLKGNKKDVLIEPYTLLISDEMATKYFGSENPLGKTLTVDGAHEFKITGILAAPKGNTQLNFNFIASYASLDAMGLYSDAWGQFGTDQTFVLLKDPASETEFEVKLPQVITDKVNPGLAALIELELQPFNQIYFHSNMNGEFSPVGDLQKVYLFSIIAALIMLIASLNFMNLSTARSVKRAKEVGIKKTFGSNRSLLIRQFLTESVFMTLLATIFGLIIFRILYPILNDYIGRELTIYNLANPVNIIILFVLAIIVGLISGFYPALYLSRFTPMNILNSNTGKKGSLFRKVIVIIQFTIAVVLIIVTIFVYKQLNFFRNTELGFEKSRKLIISMEDTGNEDDLITMKNELLKIPEVVSATCCFVPPGSPSIMMMNTMEENKTMDDGFMISALTGDFDYLSLFDIQIIEGRDFSEEFASDLTASVIINETAVSKFGFEQPLGKKIMLPAPDHQMIAAEVIGVVKDFKFQGLREEVSPVMIYNAPSTYMTIAIDYPEGKETSLLKDLNKTWEEISPGFPLNYSFLDEDYSRLYEAEEKMGQLFIFFSILIIFVACLGVFGLASFLAEQRTKEIGIRKVMGAETSQIVMLLAGDFVKWVLVAVFIAVPAAYFLVRKWLQNFAYKTTMDAWVFVFAGLIILVIAFITVSSQSFKTAVQDPTKTLKYE